MTIYSIADLHLGDKPMDVFGAHWSRHFSRVKEDWLNRVEAEDIVLMPGDFSWAMQLDEARDDLRAVGELPGRKILVRGNHDYWWSAIGRVREALPTNMYAIQNDALRLDGALFAGSRGWILPAADTPEADVKIYERELMRLEMSLKAARNISSDLPLYALLHYPPLTLQRRESGFTRLFGLYGVAAVVYGHLHGAALKGAFRGEADGVFYHQVSCDGLDFRLSEVASL